ncbi:uncharacterized protein V6R79_020420 [Siganus canaliculatus]
MAQLHKGSAGGFVRGDRIPLEAGLEAGNKGGTPQEDGADGTILQAGQEAGKEDGAPLEVAAALVQDTAGAGDDERWSSIIWGHWTSRDKTHWTSGEWEHSRTHTRSLRTATVEALEQETQTVGSLEPGNAGALKEEASAVQETENAVALEQNTMQSRILETMQFSVWISRLGRLQLWIRGRMPVWIRRQEALQLVDRDRRRPGRRLDTWKSKSRPVRATGHGEQE